MIINKKIFLPNFSSSLPSWNYYYYKNSPFHIFTITISLCSRIPNIKLWSITHRFCFIFSNEHLDLYSASQVVSASSAQSPLQLCFHNQWAIDNDRRLFWAKSSQNPWRNTPDIQGRGIVTGIQTCSGSCTAKTFFSLCWAMWIT